MAFAPVEWFCNSRGCYRPSILRYLRPLATLPLPRYTHQSWVRFRRPLDSLPPLPEEISLTPIDAAFMERLRHHPEKNENQCRSAFKFWETGFGDGYLWMEEENPLCMIWVMTEAHQHAIPRLGIWSGMYPPIAPGIGIAEGVYTFRRGLRRRAGAATTMAQALFHHMRRLGFQEMRTQIHAGNIAALRWAERVGWQPMGMIHRCAFDLPLLRDRYLYIHEIQNS